MRAAQGRLLRLDQHERSPEGRAPPPQTPATSYAGPENPGGLRPATRLPGPVRAVADATNSQALQGPAVWPSPSAPDWGPHFAFDLPWRRRGGAPHRSWLRGADVARVAPFTRQTSTSSVRDLPRAELDAS